MANEAALLSRIRQYDTEALAQVYDEYYDRIYRYAYRYLGQVDAAEDLTANVFLRLLQAVHSGSCPRTNLSAWLYRVAHNLVVDTFRRSRPPELELAEWLESAEADPIDSMEQRMQMERVRRALRQLPPSQQQVIVLRFLEGFETAEIALILGKSEGAIGALQHRALATLRQILTAEHDGGSGASVLSAEQGGHQQKKTKRTPGRNTLPSSLVGLLVDSKACWLSSLFSLCHALSARLKNDWEARTAREVAQ